ncbi:MAG: hypothetical protein IMF02_14995, partial [Proteobacteria bacterium]|nr:hypothetical protein [Pseudomonadota bacterium]
YKRLWLSQDANTETTHFISHHPGQDSGLETSSPELGGENVYQYIRVTTDLADIDNIQFMNKLWRLADNNAVVELHIDRSHKQWTPDHILGFSVNSKQGDGEFSKRGYHGTFIAQAMDTDTTKSPATTVCLLTAVKDKTKIAKVRKHYGRIR